MPKFNYITSIGDDFIIPLTFFKSDGVTPADITGAAIALLLKANASIPDSDPSVITVNGTLSNPSGGLANVSIPNSTTVNYSGTYYYKLKLTASGGQITTFAYGVITFTQAGSSMVSNTANGLTINMASGVVLASTYEQDQFTPTNGQTDFNLSFIPQSKSQTVYLNGVATVDYTLIGLDLTWTGRTLTNSDAILVTYVKV